jgi:hypothetical protein
MRQDRATVLRLSVLACLTAGAVALGSVKAAPAPQVEGVGFVGFAEVAGSSYPESDVVNPALIAGLQMEYGRCGRDVLAEMKARSSEDPRFREVNGKNGSVGDLKSAIDRGLPIYTRVATTSRAHVLYLVPKLCATFKKIELVGPGLASGSLGEMIPLAEIRKLRKADCTAGLDDSVISRPRIVIGYDDERQLLTVHDPSLGPGLEVKYADFEQAWSALGGQYSYPEPKDPALRPVAAPAPARARTPDDDAAVALFEGYGLEVAGDPPAAVEELRRGLAIPQVSPGREHLLRLELGVALHASGRTEEAVAELRRANEIFGSYWLAHRQLALVLRAAAGDAARAAAETEEKAAQDLSSPDAYRQVIGTLARDFPVMGCKGEYLGWWRP